MLRLLKPLLIATTILGSALGLYWAKCQLGIELIDGFQWERVFPVLNRLQRRERILEPVPGETVVNAENEYFFPLRHWTRLWSEEKMAGAARVVPLEGADGGACLRIDHRSEKSWAIHRFDLVRTGPGDTFSIDAKVQAVGAGVHVAIEALAFDRQGNRSKPLGVLNFQEASGWIDASLIFSVPESAPFIRLSIRGKGVGSVWIDGLQLKREK